MEEKEEEEEDAGAEDEEGRGENMGNVSWWMGEERLSCNLILSCTRAEDELDVADEGSVVMLFERRRVKRPEKREEDVKEEGEAAVNDDEDLLSGSIAGVSDEARSMRSSFGVVGDAGESVEDMPNDDMDEGFS